MFKKSVNQKVLASDKDEFFGGKYSILPLIKEKNKAALENPDKHIQITKEQSF